MRDRQTYGHHFIFIIENIIYLGVIELKRRYPFSFKKF